MSLPWERFTEDQLRAALLVDRPVVAAAGAGAGKTAVMAVRYCACLLDRDPQGRLLGPERVLAIAFTREAAANLRARIDRTLRALLAPSARRFPRPLRDQEGDAPLDADELRHLDACLRDLPAAPITTFDGFCLDQVREHAARLGRDPELAPPDELAWSSCHEAAWAALRQEAVVAGEGHDLVLLAAVHGEPTLRRLVRRFADQASTLPGRPLSVLPGDPLRAACALRGEQLAALPAALAEACRLAKPGSALAGVLRALAPAPPAAPAQLAAWLGAVAELSLSGVRDAAFKQAVRVLQDLVDHPNQRVGEGKRPGRAERCRRASLAAVAAWAPAVEETAREDAERLARQARRYAELLDQEAARRGLAGFARIEAEALALVADRDVARGLGQRFRHALLDEAQDFNRLQAGLIDRLQAAGTTVFTVGDHRQSIFGFRHAAPEVFAAWEERVSGLGGAAIPLAMNFRSHPDLVAGVRAIFAQPSLAAAFRTGAIVAGRDAADFGPAELRLWRLEPPPDADGKPPAPTSLAASQAQAAHIADLVRASLVAGRRPEEHVVILRTRSRMRLYAAALERCGIPYDTDFPNGLFDSQECHDLEAMLRLALCPDDRFALAVAMGGPWGVHDAQDRTLLAELLAAPAGSQLAEAGLAAATRVPEVLTGLRARLSAEGVAPALRWLSRQEALVARYARLPLARRRLANLALIAEEADAAGEALDAAGFIARLHLRRRLGADGGEAEGEALGGRGVRLMTIHGAKGLEWPVVFLPDCDRRLDARDLRGPALALPQAEGLHLACAARAGDTDDDPAGLSLRAGLVQDALYRRQQDEEARLFYVACTRAREALHLLATSDPSGLAADLSAACHADWLGASGLDWTTCPVAAGAPPAEAAAALRLGVGGALTVEPLPPLASAAAAPAVAVRAVSELLADELDGPVDPAAGAAGADRRLARELGTALHAALARFGPGMDAAQAARALAPFAGLLPVERQERLRRVLCDRTLVPEYWQATTRLCEQPVLGELVDGDGSRLVRGDCDLLLRDAEGWHLYDYKSGSAVERGSGHQQVRCYARLVRPHLDGPLLGAWLVDVEQGRRVRVELGPADEAAAWAGLRAGYDG